MTRFVADCERIEELVNLRSLVLRARRDRDALVVECGVLVRKVRFWRRLFFALAGGVVLATVFAMAEALFRG